MNKKNKTIKIGSSILILFGLVLYTQVALAQAQVQINRSFLISEGEGYNADIIYGSDRSLVVWIQSSPDTDYVYGAIVRIPLQLPIEPFLISTQFHTKNIEDVSVAYNSTHDEFLVCWCNPNYVYGQRIHGTGTLNGNNFIIVPTEPLTQLTRSVALSCNEIDVIYNPQDNGYLLAYRLHGQGGDINGIMLDQFAENDGESFFISLGCNQEVAYNSAENVFMITYGDTGYCPNILAKTVDSSGNVSDVINVSFGAEHFLPNVAYNSSRNEYLFAWHFSPFGLFTQQIWARRFNGDGTPISNQYVLIDGEMPMIALDLLYDARSGTGYMVSWTPQSMPFDYNVYGYRLSNIGQPAGNLINIAASQTYEVLNSMALDVEHNRYVVIFRMNNKIYGKFVKAGPFQTGPQLPGGPQSIENDPYSGSSCTFSLNQSYPNPLHNVTTINYQLPVTSYVSLKIYTPNGKLVHTLVNEVKASGHYSVVWDGEDCFGDRVADGIYFYKLQAGNYGETKKMLVIK
jgi:hypothetical protein